ncbi:hypothetical protein [Conexibacter arvalis]|uniref:Ig-like domain-containing protein n=1 Tax=Conexibacter arvalis TaxID=912552 RepID=A0A840IFE5_9ACTN|nr:hypothetical protein [Conexibacter arvalis]MBB4663549.1 hypothetical protein [Conexibacter arvalis]
MLRLARLALLSTALLALSVLFASSAHASRGLSVSPTTLTASGRLTMNGTITCTVTTNITANRSIAKTAAATIGSVTSGTITGCSGLGITGGTFGVPSPFAYNSFTGTLPNITGLGATASIVSFTLRGTLPGATTCTYAGPVNWRLIFLLLRWGEITWEIAQELLRMAGSDILCPARLSIAGTQTVASPPTVALI